MTRRPGDHDPLRVVPGEVRVYNGRTALVISRADTCDGGITVRQWHVLTGGALELAFTGHLSMQPLIAGAVIARCRSATRP